MNDRQRLNESVSVRITTDDRIAATRFGDGDCSAFMRMATRLMIRAMLFLQEDIATRLGGKKKAAIPNGEVALMRLILNNLEKGQRDTILAFERVDDWWVWVAIDGLMLRYGAVSAKTQVKEQGFAVAVKFCKREGDRELDPADFWAWAEVENVGNVWSFGEALDA